MFNTTIYLLCDLVIVDSDVIKHICNNIMCIEDLEEYLEDVLEVFTRNTQIQPSDIGTIIIKYKAVYKNNEIMELYAIKALYILIFYTSLLLESKMEKVDIWVYSKLKHLL